MDRMEGDKAQKDIEEPQDMKTNISNPSEPIQTEDLHRPSQGEGGDVASAALMEGTVLDPILSLNSS